VKTSWNVYFPSRSNFCIAVCLNHPNPYITKKLCCCYTPGPSPKSGVVSAAPSVNEQTPLKLPKGWSYTKLAANVNFLHISHIVLTSATPYHFKADGKYIFWDFCNVRLRYNGSIDYYEDGPLTAVIFSFYYKVSAIRNETKYTHKTLPINILQTHESHIRTSGASNCIITIIIITIIIIIKHFKDAGFQVTTTTTSILHFSICERTKTCRGKENIYLFCKYFKDITR